MSSEHSSIQDGVSEVISEVEFMMEDHNRM